MTACVRCGYDLAGTPGQGVCPECALPACISREVLMGWTPRRRTLVWTGVVLGFLAVIGCVPLAALVLLPITGPLGLGRDAERVVAGSLVLSSLALSASIPMIASAAAVRRRSPSASWCCSCFGHRSTGSSSRARAGGVSPPSRSAWQVRRSGPRRLPSSFPIQARRPTRWRPSRLSR